MLYRSLGRSGLKVSVLSYGNWLTAHSKEAEEVQIKCVQLAFKNGINFFDTAEVYGFGQAERTMGKGLASLKTKRSNYVVSTKLFWSEPAKEARPNRNGLSRKHLIEGMEDSLANLQLTYVDLLFCHRPDMDTPMEEICRAMSWLIDQNKTLYWGTSEWPSSMVAAANETCRRLNLHKPVAEQCEYSMLVREKMENEYNYVFQEYGTGTTVWSPLKSGLLTGKYNTGDKLEDSRFAKEENLAGLWKEYMGTEALRTEFVSKMERLEVIAKELGGTMPQFALAWAVVNQDTTTCILGASKVSQLEENLKALDLVAKWTPEIEARVDQILGNKPENWRNYRNYEPIKSRRMQGL